MDPIRKWFTNNFVFNNPTFDYKDTNISSKSIIFIKKGKNTATESYIPCLFIQEYEQSSKFIIFFHGNSEDIFISELFGQYFAEKLKMNVIIPEYPGYSIYDEEKSAETMCLDSLIVYSFIKETFKLEDDDIYVIGRSIGTGPAVYLSSKKRPKGLILISPFKSIKSVKGAFIGFFLLDIFNSIDIIDKVICPVLFIHGREDQLIDYSHSEDLMLKLESNIQAQDNENEIIINPNMTHNDMDIEKDIFDKIKEFLANHSFSPQKRHFNLLNKQFKHLFDIPIPIQKFFLKLNLQLNIPIIITKRGRNSILLNDERIAMVNNNFEIVINEQDDIEFELKIKTNEIGTVNYLLELPNDILVASSNYFINFYILKKFKYEFKKSIKIKNKIIKIVQYNEQELLVLTEGELLIYNFNQFNLCNELKGDYGNMAVINSLIVLYYPYKKQLLFIRNINGKLEVIYSINHEILDVKNNLISVEDKCVAFMDKFKFNVLIIERDDKQNIIKLDIKDYVHFFNEPFYIFKIYNNLLIIGDKSGEIRIYEVNDLGNITQLFNQKLHKFNNRITSITALKDGKLFFTNDYESKGKIIGNVEKEKECKYM
jgi:esterase/lipase